MPIRSLAPVLFLLACTSNTDETTDGDTVVTDHTDTGPTLIDDPDGTIETATPFPSVAWETGVSYLLGEGAIDFAGDRDFFVFSPTEGDIYRLYTSAWTLPIASKADMVIRVYDSAGEEIRVEDDMLFRYWNTDTGFYFEAYDAGPFYIEILEYNDYAGIEPYRGGTSYTYQLLGSRVDITEHEGWNDAVEDFVDDEDYIAVYEVNPFAEDAREFFGRKDDVEDVDVWPFWIPSERHGTYQAWTLWPGSPPGYRMELYNHDMQLVGLTDQPTSDGSSAFLWDVGILHRVSGGQLYYLKVFNEDADPGYGSAYAGVWQGWSSDLGTFETESNNLIDTANNITFARTSDEPLIYTGRHAGTLPATDDQDVLAIVPNQVGGTLVDLYLGLTLQGQSVGSLADLRIRITDRNGGTLHQETVDPLNGHPDPIIRDWQIPTSDNIYVWIEAEAQDEDVPIANTWFLEATVSEDPLYE